MRVLPRIPCSAPHRTRSLLRPPTPSFRSATLDRRSPLTRQPARQNLLALVLVPTCAAAKAACYCIVQREPPVFGRINKASARWLSVNQGHATTLEEELEHLPIVCRKFMRPGVREHDCPKDFRPAVGTDIAIGRWRYSRRGKDLEVLSAGLIMEPKGNDQRLDATWL